MRSGYLKAAILSDSRQRSACTYELPTKYIVFTRRSCCNVRTAKREADSTGPKQLQRKSGRGASGSRRRLFFSLHAEGPRRARSEGSLRARTQQRTARLGSLDRLRISASASTYNGLGLVQPSTTLEPSARNRFRRLPTIIAARLRSRLALTRARSLRGSVPADRGDQNGRRTQGAGAAVEAARSRLETPPRETCSWLQPLYTRCRRTETSSCLATFASRESPPSRACTPAQSRRTRARSLRPTAPPFVSR